MNMIPVNAIQLPFLFSTKQLGFSFFKKTKQLAFVAHSTSYQMLEKCAGLRSYTIQHNQSTKRAVW